MSRILAYTSPARGHLFPIVPLLAELARRGHDVQVRTLAGEVARVGGLGLSARAISGDVEGVVLDDWREASPLGQVRRVMETWLARAPHEVDDLRAAIADARPDALVVDVNSWGAISAAESSGLPFAVYAPYFLDLALPGRPPFGLGLAPWRGPLGWLRDALVRAVGRRTVRPFVARLNALRAGLGVGPVDGLSDLALTARRVLYLTAEAFEHAHGGWPEKVRFVGPGLWEPPSPPLARPARPLVLVTCSTELQHDGRLVEVALDALAAEDVDVIATTAALDPASFRAPANARVVRYESHGAILPHAAAVVCHGGMGITQKALSAGVPVCVVPFGRDQLDVARHVELAGVGTRVAPGKLTAPRLRAAVRDARRLAPAARRMADAFAGTGGADAAAREVEALLASA